MLQVESFRELLDMSKNNGSLRKNFERILAPFCSLLWLQQCWFCHDYKLLVFSMKLKGWEEWNTASSNVKKFADFTKIYLFFFFNKCSLGYSNPLANFQSSKKINSDHLFLTSFSTAFIKEEIVFRGPYSTIFADIIYSTMLKYIYIYIYLC